MSDEAEVSAPLWLFCALLALYLVPRHRLSTSMLGQRSAGLSRHPTTDPLPPSSLSVSSYTAPSAVTAQTVLTEHMKMKNETQNEFRMTACHANAEEQQHSFGAVTSSGLRLNDLSSDLATLKQIARAQLALEEMCRDIDLEGEEQQERDHTREGDHER